MPFPQTGPLPTSMGCKYVCTAVDTYSGVLVTYPCKFANQNSTLKCLNMIEQYYGLPLQIQTDNGSHFTGFRVKTWSDDHNVEWIYHVPYHPQAAGLVERMNGLLKEALKKREQGTLNNWRKHIFEVVKCLNNRPLGEGQTPLNRMITVVDSTDRPIKMWKTDPRADMPIRATRGSAGLDLVCIQTATLLPKRPTVVSTGLGLKCPSGMYGHVLARAGLTTQGVDVKAGVIDNDYEGEIKVIMYNNNEQPFVIEQGIKIAQLLIKPCQYTDVLEIPEPLILQSKAPKSKDMTGHKVWVKSHTGPPKAGEVIAQGKDQVVTVMFPGEDKWVNVGIDKCYERRN